MNAEITLTVSDDRAEWDRVFGAAKSLDGLASFSGIFDDELASRAYRHEIGKGVPMRPFGGPSADQATPRAMGLAAREIGDVLDGDQSAKDALEEVGEVFADSMVQYVELGRVGGKKLSKAAKAGDSRKLIDSGDMIDAVEVQVTKSVAGEAS